MAVAAACGACAACGAGAARAQDALASSAHAAAAADETPSEARSVAGWHLPHIGVDEHLGARVPRGLVFRDQAGRRAPLDRFFDGRRPVVLVFAYHSCPVLCSLVQDAAARALRRVDWTVGDQMRALTVSIDPRDTPARAAQARRRVLRAYGRGGAPAARGWTYLVGEEREIRALTRAVGWRYAYDEAQQQYAHPAAILVLTPDGRVARYLYGLDVDAGDLRLALLEASRGRTLSTIERVVLHCYQYDPDAHGYTLAAGRIASVGAGACSVVLGGALFALWRRERRRGRGREGESARVSRPPTRRTPSS